MAIMSISLSDKMREQIRERVKSGDYHNESEYIRDLVRRDYERKTAEMELLADLERANLSGNSNMTMEDIRAQAKLKIKSLIDQKLNIAE